MTPSGRFGIPLFRGVTQYLNSLFVKNLILAYSNPDIIKAKTPIEELF